MKLRLQMMLDKHLFICVLLRERERYGVDMGSMRAALPSVGMVIVLLAQVSNMEVIKAAMSKGINKYVIIVYSDALSSLFFLFCSFLFHRSERPQLTVSILCSFFLLSVFGCSSQIFSFVGIQYNSPTLSTAMLNLIPAFTFVLAIIFRLEKLNWENKSSQAKSLGTFVSIGGAFVVTFYKGPPLIGELSHSGSPRRLLLSPQLSWILGGFFLAAEAFMSSAWFILQALILRKFAAVLIIMFYLFFFNTILSTAFALIVVSEPSDWKLGLDIGLVAVLYSAVIGTGFRVGLCTWCLSRTGPLYVSMFKPLAIVFSIVMDVVIVGDAFCLGSLIGAMIIGAGFYAVMWGKSKEEKTTEDCGLGIVNPSREKVPLLQNSPGEFVNQRTREEVGLDLRSMRAVLPFMGMVIVILVQVSNMFVIKKAISIGINKYVIVVYTDVICSLIFLLFILITHRLIFPTVTKSVLWKIFLLSLISCSSDFSSYIGLQYGSPTLNTAMLNLIPAFTFILAIIFRMEKLKWRSKSSQAKSLGTIVSIAGAFVVTFYKGPSIVRSLSDIASLDQIQPLQSNWILGGFYLAAQAILISACLKEFPALIVMLCYQYFFSTILAAMFSLTVVTELSAWKLRLDVGLFAIAYSAVIGAAFLTTLLLWCLMRAGPLYVSMFKPLAILFSTVMGVIIFGDGLFLGSLVGAVIIVIGFYVVMWGKAKEENTIDDCGTWSSELSSEKVPLLQNSTEDTKCCPSV